MNRWSKAFWIDLGERVAATFIAALIPLYVATANAFAIQWPHVLELAASAAGLSLLKGLLANLASPGSGPSAIPAPPAPEVEPAGDTPNAAARADLGERIAGLDAHVTAGVRQGGTVVRVIPRTDPRLGRHVEHDPRSRAFPAPATAPIVSKTWRHYGPILDQGQVGSCTGNAMAQALNTHPLHRSRTPYRTETDAVALYSLATSLDDVPGAYPPQDTGSSGLAVAKAAQQKGYIAAYTHAFGLDHTLAALMNGPVLLGTDWLSNMFQPDASGNLDVSGEVAGGHEYLLIGADVTRRKVTILNSWGRSWGKGGRAYMSFDDLDRLLRAGGDATQPVLA